MESRNEIHRSIEAVLMAASSPVSAEEIANACESDAETIAKAIKELKEEYAQDARGFQIDLAASGFRFITAQQCYDVVSRFITEPLHSRLSPSAMETLAVIAYKQPVSRGQISSIRGVNVDSVIKTLESRGYIAEIGRDSGPGQAILYGTTEDFLDRIGISSIKELPSLGDFVPDASIMEQFEKSLLGEVAVETTQS